MKYNVSFKLADPNDKNKVLAVTGTCSIVDSEAFAYGNRKAMIFEYDSGLKGEQLYDIRYDTSYNSKDEPAYIKGFIRKVYCGMYGAWKATYIKVKPIKTA